MLNSTASRTTGSPNEAAHEQKIFDLEARVTELQKALAESETAPEWKSSVGVSLATVDRILSQLVSRVQELESKYAALKGAVAAPRIIDPTSLDRALKELSTKTGEKKNPNLNYLNGRFKDFDAALQDIRNLAYSRDCAHYERYPAATTAGKTPSFHPLKAKACTETDLRSEWAAFWARELQMQLRFHRKCWELCYVPQILHNEGKLHEGSRGLGFACGEEPLPSLFAKCGVRVLATDLEPTRAEAQGWLKSNQHLGSFEKLRRREICGDEARLATIEGRYLDMNAIPGDLHGLFDFCWSVCSLEHLGSIANGLNFIENSLLTLKPGGISVHTTEFNIRDGETVDNWPTVLFQKKHLLELAGRLKARGFSVYDFDFDMGQGILDGFVDLPPYFDPESSARDNHAHLKLSIDGFVCTSFGFIVKKPDA